MAKKRRRRSYRRPKKSLFDFSLPRFEVDSGIKRGMLVIFILSFGAVSLLSLFDLSGVLGVYLSNFLTLILGWGKWIFPLVVLTVGFLLYNEKRYHVRTSSYIGVFLFILSIQSLFHLFFEQQEWEQLVQQGQGGGYIGYFVALGFIRVIGFWASIVVILALLITSLMLIFNTTLERIVGSKSPFALIIYPFKLIFNKILQGKDNKKNKDSKDNYEDEIEEDYEEDIRASIQSLEKDDHQDPSFVEENFTSKSIGEKKTAKPQIKKTEILNIVPEETLITESKPSAIKIDIPLDLLNSATGKPTSGDIKNNILIIKRTLENFGIKVEMGEVQVGPTVTQYSFKPANGVKVVRITALRNDLALALAAHPIRIEAPIPGKSLIGIEVPNQKKAIVSLKEILDAPSFKAENGNLTLALGKDVSGQVWFDNLAKMPHLIVAGATNSGKSVCLNTVIISLLYQNNPDELQFIMVDPKRVELTMYNNIPHLLTPVITDVPKTINALKWCLNEMDRRFDFLSQKKEKNIQSYNSNLKPGEERMSYIIFIIDELADLMISAKRDVETAITRLAQMSRAVGIHLILATQRPSTDVITGLIKANMPARIAFAVASNVDSRTILDASGAEDLLGQGDMLLSTPLLSKPKRLQGAYLSDNEIKKVVRYIKDQVDGETNYIDEITKSQTVGGVAGIGMDSSGDGDELLGEAKDLVINSGKASASLLQRRLSVGYARAARIIDLLEANGVVGPANGAKPREILINQHQYEIAQSMPMSGMPIHNRAESVAPDSYLGEDEPTPTVFKSSYSPKEEQLEEEDEEVLEEEDVEEKEQAIDEENDDEEFEEDEYEGEKEDKDIIQKNSSSDKSNDSPFQTDDIYNDGEENDEEDNEEDKNEKTDDDWEDEGKFFSR